MHENLPDEAARTRVTVLWDEVEPGSEAQIDYGFLGQWINPGTGKRHRIWAFVMVLPCSRHMFVRPVIYMDQNVWTETHVEAFRYFGGIPRRLVPDNLRTAVDRPDLFLISLAQSVSPIGGPPGVIPASSAGRRYFRTVLRSRPKEAPTWLFERPAYQWT
ncbi:hypothetical protein [Streptomyces racemochromogenes]|uniref:hypothetical protein n=1 Tax=Streptomyces racemochromogenes TaxID=67353 RepID=UPI0031EE3944